MQEWSCRTTDGLQKLDRTVFFRESHPIQLRCTCKVPYSGAPITIQTAAKCPVWEIGLSVKVTLSQYPNNKLAFFNICSVHSICATNDGKSKSNTMTFFVTGKAFPMNDSTGGAAHTIHCHRSILEMCSKKHFLQNFTYHLLNIGAKDLTDNWEDVRNLMNRLLV